MQEIENLLAQISYLKRVGVENDELETARQRLLAHLSSGQAPGPQAKRDQVQARQALANARQAALDAGVPEADFGGGPDDLSTGLIALDQALSPDDPTSDPHAT